MNKQDIQLELLEEIENKIEEFVFNHIGEYGVEIVEGNSDAFNDLKDWLSEKKIELEELKGEV